MSVVAVVVELQFGGAVVLLLLCWPLAALVVKVLGIQSCVCERERVQSDIINNINIESGNKAQEIWIVTDWAGRCVCLSRLWPGIEW